MRKLKAFTILELLVVISVLSILFAIAMPRFKGMQDNANIVKVKSELKTIRGALESYMTFHFNGKNDYSLSGNFTDGNFGYDLQASFLTFASPRLISSIIYDPFYKTTPFEYTYWSAGERCFLLFSLGAGDDSRYIDVALDPTLITNNYNQATGEFTVPAAYPNMIYVTNNSPC